MPCTSFLSTHVTALKFVGDYLLVGEGKRVKCYNWRDKQYLESIQVFLGCSVHGIRIISPSQDYVKLVIFGAKSVRIFNFLLRGDERFIEQTQEQCLEDWIHDVRDISTLGSTKEYEDIFAVVTAHNSLILWDSNKSEVTKQFHCSEKCILYSATILSSEIDSFIIAAGTVFKEVIIWSPNILTDHNTDIVPFHRLTGHQGVIFSISYNAHLRLLCTTSDDRGLRLWKFSHPDVSENPDSHLSLSSWKTGSFHLIQSSFAHESRIWTSAILPNCIISIGEDCTVCFWTHSGILITKEKCHRGGNIWCIDVNEDNLIAATGGSDSGVLLWNISQMISEPHIGKISMGNNDNNFPRTLAFLSNANQQSILCTTENGILFSYDLHTNEHSVIHHDPSHSSYSVLSKSPCGSFILLGSLDGIVNAFRYDKGQFLVIKKWKAVDGKVHNILWVDNSSKLILTCGLKGQMMLWSIEEDENTWDFTLRCQLQLPASRNHWWTTVGCHIPSRNSLVVGDGSGSIHLYSNITEWETQVVPCYTYQFMHGKHGVTDIQQQGNFVYTAGRDGRVMCYITTTNGLKLLHSLKTPHNLEWLVKLLFVKDDLIVLGFHTTHFIAWSSKYDRILMKVDCGGGHRSWDFLLASDESCIFATIKRKEIVYARRDLKFLLNESTIQNGISGMALCCTCYIFEYTNLQFGKMSVLACGGEDPALKFIGVPSATDAPNACILLRSILGHLSSIRAIAKCSIAESVDVLMVTAGGRAQLMVWVIRSDKDLVCEEIATDFLWNVDRPSKKTWKEKSEPILDPQTRYMDVVVWPSSHKPKEEFCIALACSDSFIRLHTINISKKNFMRNFIIPYGQHCVLKLSLMSSLRDNSIYFASAGNDGHFKIYNSSFMLKVCDSNVENSKSGEKDFVNMSFEPVWQQSVHQSGVNALDTMQTSDNDWLICSGGDDNALSAVLFQIDKSCEFEGVTTIAMGMYANSHASQITGVKILPYNQLLSVSIDQRLNYWQLKQTGNILNFQILRSVMSSIPDIAHLEMWTHTKEMTRTLVVCGQGLESFKFEAVPF